MMMDPRTLLQWVLEWLDVEEANAVLMLDMMSESALGAPVSAWAQAILTFVVILVLRRWLAFLPVLILSRLMRPLYRKLPYGPEGPLRPLVRAGLFYLACYQAYQVMWAYFPVDLFRVNATIGVIFLFWLIYLMMKPITGVTSQLRDWWAEEFIDWLNRLIKGMVIFVAAAAILDIWGVKIGPVLAGLGLFGAAVALGAQDLFRSLISGVLILAEQRFHVGDLVKVNDEIFGWVEQIGFRSTRIRNLAGMPQYIPNMMMADLAVLNIQRSTRRLIEWHIELGYESSPEKLQCARDRIERFVFEDDAFISPDEDYCEIRLEGFSRHAINLYIFCYTVAGGWRAFMAERERLAFAVMRILTEEGVSFAINPHTLYWGGNRSSSSMVAGGPSSGATIPDGGDAALRPRSE